MKAAYKKRLAVLCIAALTITGTACGDGGGSKANNGETPAANASSHASDNKASAEPASISLFVSNNAEQIPPGKSMDLATVKHLAGKTNTELDITFLPHENYMEQLRLKFAGGDIPDVHMVWGIENSELVTNDLALDLKPYLEKHGQHLLKEIPQSAWDAVTLNGQILAIPQVAQGNAPAERVIYVRKDWLDKLGLAVPKTSDEFLDMLRAFRDKDPNGNGKQDEIPFSSREKFEWMDNVLGMYGVNLDSNTVSDGKVMPGFVTPNMKQSLGLVRTMYEEKLIDPEFLTNSRAVWDQKIKSDLVGSWNHVVLGVWDSWQKEMSTLLADKKPNVVAIPTPKGAGYEGDVGRVEKSVLKTFVVKKDAANPEAIVRMFDWLVTEEGQLFADLGIEGETFTKAGEQLTYNADADKDLKWRQAVFTLHGFNEAAQKVKINNEEAFNKLMATIETSRSEGIDNPTAGMAPSPAMTQNAELSFKGSLFQEAAAKIVLGEKSLDYFDEFVASWKKQGGEQAIEEMTAWYNENRK